jgi:hypothetical protein
MLGYCFRGRIVDYPTFVRFLFELGLIVLKIIGIIFVITSVYYFIIATVVVAIGQIRQRSGKVDATEG